MKTYAENTRYYDSLKKELNNYSDKQKKTDLEGIKNLVNLTNNIIKQDIKFVDIIAETENEEFINIGVL